MRSMQSWLAAIGLSDWISCIAYALHASGTLYGGLLGVGWVEEEGTRDGWIFAVNECDAGAFVC